MSLFFITIASGVVEKNQVYLLGSLYHHGRISTPRTLKTREQNYALAPSADFPLLRSPFVKVAQPFDVSEWKFLPVRMTPFRLRPHFSDWSAMAPAVSVLDKPLMALAMEMQNVRDFSIALFF